MTNEKLYESDIERISKEDETLGVAVRNGKPTYCSKIRCSDCDLEKGSDYNCKVTYRKWLKSEAESEKSEPEKKEEKMEKDKIKVGDTVKVTEDPVLKGKMRFGALMGEGYKYPEGFFREDGKEK